MSKAHLRDLKPDALNARKHSVRNVGMIERSIQSEGFGRAILLANDGTVIAGNATIEAAASAGIEHVRVIESDGTEVIAVKRTDVAPESERFYKLAIADNRAAELASWDIPNLQQVFDAGVDGNAFWFPEELSALFAEAEPETTAGLTDPDAVPEPPKEPITKPGDLWLLGRHRLLCGDATNPQHIERVLDGGRVDLCFTSPPYNLGTTTGGGFPSRGGMWQKSGLENGYSTYSDDMPQAEYFAWQADILTGLWSFALSEDGAIFYNHRPRVQDGALITPFAWNPGLPIRQVVIWNSGAGINFAPTHYRPSCEWIVIFAKPGFRLDSKSASGCGDVWDIPAEQRDGSHPAPFPVALPSRALETTGADSILDPFAGSGTTIIAAEELGRVGRGLEISPAYCDVIVNRWQDFTGQTATLERRAD